MLNCKNITEKLYFRKQNTGFYLHFDTMQVDGELKNSNMTETEETHFVKSNDVK